MAFRKSVLLELGGFDPRFWPGEEMVAAFNVSKRGHHIVFQPDACLYHYPRATFGGFIKQIYGYGATRIRLIREGLDFEFTTVVPAIWVASVILLGFAALFCRWCLILLGLNLAFYLFADLVVTLITFCKSRRGVDLMLFLLIPAMHVSYGLAEWMELFRPDVDLSEGVDRTKDTASGSPTAHEDVKAEEGV